MDTGKEIINRLKNIEAQLGLLAATVSNLVVERLSKELEGIKTKGDKKKARRKSKYKPEGLPKKPTNVYMTFQNLNRESVRKELLKTWRKYIPVGNDGKPKISFSRPDQNGNPRIDEKTGKPEKWTIAKELGLRWRSLSVAEKEPYVAEFKRLKEEYNVKFEEWKKKNPEEYRKMKESESGKGNGSSKTLQVPKTYGQNESFSRQVILPKPVGTLGGNSDVTSRLNKYIS